MSEKTRIEWADSTANDWMGCTPVSDACDNCYAAVSAPARVHGVEWGPGMPRLRTSEHNRNLPKRWNAQPFYECRSCGWRGHQEKGAFGLCPNCPEGVLAPARRRVFCQSLSDIFDNEVPAEWRFELFDLIGRTANLDWLLLTKRIGNANRMMTEAGGWHDSRGTPHQHVWMGASICNQKEADRDVHKLLGVPAVAWFLSIEPMLGPIKLSADFLAKRHRAWVIVGGESGRNARPMHPVWARSLRDQCEEAGVPYFFKQWGEWAPFSRPAGAWVPPGRQRFMTWREEEQRFVPEPPASFDDFSMRRDGKVAAGRELDGRIHTAFPRPQFPFAA